MASYKAPSCESHAVSRPNLTPAELAGVALGTLTIGSLLSGCDPKPVIVETPTSTRQAIIPAVKPQVTVTVLNTAESTLSSGQIIPDVLNVSPEKTTPTPSTELTNQYKGLDINSDPATWTKDYILENGEKFNMSKYWQEVSIDPLTNKTFREGANMTQVEMEKQDKLALKVLNNIRRAFLVDKKILTETEAKNMSDWDLFLQHVKYGIENNQLINLAPEEIIKINAMLNLPSYRNGPELQEGIMINLQLNHDKAQEYLQRFKNGELSYQIDIFGRETIIPRSAFNGVAGDLAGLFRLPGINPEDMVGSLAHYTDKETGEDYWFIMAIPFKSLEYKKGQEFIYTNGFGAAILEKLSNSINAESAHIGARGSSWEKDLGLGDIFDNLGLKIAIHSEVYDDPKAKVCSLIDPNSGMEVGSFIVINPGINDKPTWPWEKTSPTVTPTPKIFPSVTPRVTPVPSSSTDEIVN